MVYRPLLSLAILVPILMVDAIIELSLISSMVAFIEGRGAKPWEALDNDGNTFDFPAHPENLVVDQGHTSNGAAGTAFILVGFGGLVVMWLQHRRSRAVSISRPIWNQELMFVRLASHAHRICSLSGLCYPSSACFSPSPHLFIPSSSPTRMMTKRLISTLRRGFAYPSKYPLRSVGTRKLVLGHPESGPSHNQQ